MLQHTSWILVDDFLVKNNIALGMQSEAKAPKNEEPTVRLSFTTMLQHTSRILVDDFLVKNNIALGMQSEANAPPKNGEPTVGLSFTTMLQHTSRILVDNFLAKNKVTTLKHHPCSPDLAVIDFCLFPPLKLALKRRRNRNDTEIIKNAKEELKRLSKNVFQECFQLFYCRWQKCIIVQGDYFEGNMA